MKALFISALLPYPLHSGGQIRIFNLLKRLGDKHEITLASFIRSSDELRFVKEFPFCRYVYMIHRGSAWQPHYLFKSLGRYPFLMSTYDNPTMCELVRGLVSKEHYDLIHIEPFYVWSSLPKTTIPLVVSEHNIEYEIYESYTRRFSIVPLRPFLYLDTLKLRFWEEAIWRKARAVTAVSEHDKQIIRKSNQNVYTVPNGVDTKEFPFKQKKIQARNFLYIGNFKWMENRDAARFLTQEIWPEIMKRFPGAKLRIVGKGAPDGEVKNIADELEKADIMLAPIRIGGGTKFKILEGLAVGLPVITTTVGASGFDKNTLWIADTPQEFVERVSDILKNPQKIKNARRQIEREYNWDMIAHSLDHVWTSL